MAGQPTLQLALEPMTISVFWSLSKSGYKGELAGNSAEFGEFWPVVRFWVENRTKIVPREGDLTAAQGAFWGLPPGRTRQPPGRSEPCLRPARGNAGLLCGVKPPIGLTTPVLPRHPSNAWAPEPVLRLRGALVAVDCDASGVADGWCR